MMIKTNRLLAIATLAAALSGCGGPSDFKPTEGMSVADIYAGACQACHGENGAGKFGFLLKVAQSDKSQEEIAALLKEGGHIMPSFPNMSDDERLTMAAFVKAL